MNEQWSVFEIWLETHWPEGRKGLNPPLQNKKSTRLNRRLALRCPTITKPACVFITDKIPTQAAFSRTQNSYPHTRYWNNGKFGNRCLAMDNLRASSPARKTASKTTGGTRSGSPSLTTAAAITTASISIRRPEASTARLLPCGTTWTRERNCLPRSQTGSRAMSLT